MAAAILIPISFFLVVFAITYLYFSTRNRERMALIEKGADASIFAKGKSENVTSTWKIFILNFALLLIGIGIAIFIASLLENTMGIEESIAYPGTIFLMAGIALLAGFFVTKKLV
ncbi:DUF6249 domain-containing protein [Cellulophaga sp. Hel_I_12]|uniref:DUF6249 domain-containing protein n=1 Tax=Cellulophaga sp. Hel_I_12 TaxID=1249972 RepID=UPI000647B7D5|nr:DUF6249 domain-containing protein [Cellulophaga sp. Hel_I_12]